ncbi:MAG: sensor domain-containing diguanylate cyclase [Myxococcota bacterium]|nr:sensor domain-containing diguanylate cyclase [Myxococcota bacterium]
MLGFAPRGPLILTDRQAPLAAFFSYAFGWVVGLLVVAVGIPLVVLLLVRLHFEPHRTRLHDAHEAVAMGHQATVDQDALGLQNANARLARAIAPDPDLTLLLIEARADEAVGMRVDGHDHRSTGAGPAGDRLLARDTPAFDTYRARERALVSGIDAKARAIDQALRATLEAGAALELLLLVAIGLIALRQRHAVHDAVMGPIDDLRMAIRRVRDGDLDAAVLARGALELRHVAADLADMTRALSNERARREAQENKVREYARRLRVVLEAARELSESLNLDYVLRSVSHTAALVARDVIEVTIWIVDDQTKRLIPTFYSEGPKGKPLGIEPLDLGEGVAGRAARYGRTILEPPAHGDLNLVVSAAFPMVVGARVIGIMVAKPSPGPGTKSSEFVYIMETLASHAGAAIESARLHALPDAGSQVDALTRSLNRHRLDEDLADECRRSARYARPLSVIMLDVDNFKSVNDTHGHARGDAVLQHVAETVRGALRTTDSVYRYGGEEFVVLLRETGAQAAKELAERLRRRVEQCFTHDVSGAITASFGVAELDPDEPTPTAVVEAADRALYESKRAGRNRVSLAPHGPPRLHA